MSRTNARPLPPLRYLPPEAFDRHFTYDWMQRPQRGEFEYIDGSPLPQPTTADYAEIEKRTMLAMAYGTSHPEHQTNPGNWSTFGGHPSRELYEDAS